MHVPPQAHKRIETFLRTDGWVWEPWESDTQEQETQHPHHWQSKVEEGQGQVNELSKNLLGGDLRNKRSKEAGKE